VVLLELELVATPLAGFATGEDCFDADCPAVFDAEVLANAFCGPCALRDAAA